MKKRLKEIEDEAGVLREMHAKAEKEMGLQGIFSCFYSGFIVLTLKIQAVCSGIPLQFGFNLPFFFSLIFLRFISIVLNIFLLFVPLSFFLGFIAFMITMQNLCSRIQLLFDIFSF